MNEVMKKVATAVVIMGLGALGTQLHELWKIREIEYRVIKKDSYLSNSLGQQGLALTHNGKHLPNVSVVDVVLLNRTDTSFNNAEFVFSFPADTPLVAAGVVTPKGLPHKEIVEDVPTTDPTARKFKIRIIPPRKESEYFEVIFIFDGARAPEVNVASLTKEAPVIEYRAQRDNLLAIFIASSVVLCIVGIAILLGELVGHFQAPKDAERRLRRFVDQAHDLAAKGTIRSDAEVIETAITIFREFNRPKPSLIWGRLLKARVRESTASDVTKRQTAEEARR